MSRQQRNRVVRLCALLLLGGQLLAGAAGAAAPPPAGGAAPQRIRFAAGQSSTTLAGRIDAAGTAQEYLLHARAGQVLQLRLASADANAQLLLLCPGEGTAGGLTLREGSFTLPKTGDYAVRVARAAVTAGAAPAAAFAYTLAVAVGGKPMTPAVPDNLSGTYDRDGHSGTLAVRQLSDGRIEIHVLAFSRYFKPEAGPNTGEASGVVPVVHGIAVLRPEVAVAGSGPCTLTMHFTPRSVSIDQQGADFECGFGNAVTATGDYRRTSLCADPQSMDP